MPGVYALVGNRISPSNAPHGMAGVFSDLSANGNREALKKTLSRRKHKALRDKRVDLNAMTTIRNEFFKTDWSKLGKKPEEVNGDAPSNQAN